MKEKRPLSLRLDMQGTVIGLLQTHSGPALAEMAGVCGYDFVLLDGEHGVFNQDDYLHAIRALDAVDALAIVRLAGHDLQAVGRFLDIGADAIVVPGVSTPEQARALAQSVEYPPQGTRGFGAAVHRATRYGLDTAAHVKSPRERVALIVIIESALGVENAEEILSITGVGGAIIGPSDLSAALGCAGDFAHPRYAEAFSRIERAALAKGKFIGTVPHGPYSLTALHTRGHRFFILGADVVLIREAMTTQVTQARAALQSADSQLEG